MDRSRVVIVGCGFGGLNAARALHGAPVDVTVVDRDDYHGFWPLLYQVATAGLAPDDIARPVRSLFGRASGVRVMVGTVERVDLEDRAVELDGGRRLPYDFLVLAAGSSTADFGIPGVAEHAFALKTLPDAVRLRNHVLWTYEDADAGRIDQSAPGALTTVLVGGGPTGVELAGALSELIAHNLARDFEQVDVARARVVLVEMTDRLLPGFSARSQEAALETLRAKGVEILFHRRLTRVSEAGVDLDDGTSIPASTVVWTAGVRANPVAEAVAGEKGKGGAVTVGPDLSLPAHPDVFVIGDLASARNRAGQPLPQLAQVAIQGGRHTARNIRRTLAGRPTVAFHYRNHGIMATIGRRQAVAELPGGLRLRGTVGWLAWLGVHLVFLIGFRNRLLVLINWAWNYLTWERGSRIILDERSAPPPDRPRA